MMALTPGAQIDELRRALGESEQRRQVAEVKLADRERRLGNACQTIAAQDHRIGWLTAELARMRGWEAGASSLASARSRRCEQEHPHDESKGEHQAIDDKTGDG